MIARSLLLLALLAAPAAAQEILPPADLGSAVVEELEVVARRPGPVLWRASKGDAEVIILGGVTPLPHALAWDTTRIGHALDGAKALLLPPKPRMNIMDLAGLALGGKGKLRPEEKGRIDDQLPERLRARFAAARKAALQPEDRYDRWKPQIAGFYLMSDFREAAGLSGAKPGSTVEKLARERGVAVRTVGDYRLAPLAKDASRMPTAEALACLDDAVTQLESEASQAQAWSKAWAAGDLRTVKALYGPPALERCARQAPKVADLIERGTEEGTRALLAALDEPGRTVAVIDLNFLLRSNGVLDRLKARGVTITAPEE